MVNRTLRLVLSVLVLFCTLQAIYWPLIPKPGTVYEWWQVGVLAKIGFLVGAPVLFIVWKLRLSTPAIVASGWFLALIWSAAIYYASGLVIAVLARQKNRAA
jgi:hypothetical protein